MLINYRAYQFARPPTDSTTDNRQHVLNQDYPRLPGRLQWAGTELGTGGARGDRGAPVTRGVEAEDSTAAEGNADDVGDGSVRRRVGSGQVWQLVRGRGRRLGQDYSAEAGDDVGRSGVRDISASTGHHDSGVNFWDELRC